MTQKIYRFNKNSAPRWINFENVHGAKGEGGKSNHGAKGHAWEHFFMGEEKVLCDFSGQGVVRRIWITLSDRSPDALQNVYLKMFWDGAKTPQVNVPIGDFFCMGLGEMASFENRFFSTAEGRSFLCVIPMPFRKNAKIVLYNGTQTDINNLFYDVDLTIEKLSKDDMYFCAEFHDRENALEENVKILSVQNKQGRFLGANVAVFPNEKYGNVWWGEGEMKIFLDGDTEFPTLCGTGAEDYVGSAWELGEFINACQGCVLRNGNKVSMYRFHADDPVFFRKEIKVELQAMGGGTWENVKQIASDNLPFVPVSYDDGDLHAVYQDHKQHTLKGYVNFFRKDRYRTVAYYYLKK